MWPCRSGITNFPMQRHFYIFILPMFYFFDIESVLIHSLTNSAPLLQNPWFRKSRFKGGKGKKLNVGGGGLGYRERPGLGSDSSVCF